MMIISIISSLFILTLTSIDITIPLITFSPSFKSLHLLHHGLDISVSGGRSEGIVSSLCVNDKEGSPRVYLLSLLQSPLSLPSLPSPSIDKEFLISFSISLNCISQIQVVSSFPLEGYRNIRFHSEFSIFPILSLISSLFLHIHILFDGTRD